MYNVTEKVIRLINNRLLIAGLVVSDEKPEPGFIEVSDPNEIIFDDSNQMHIKDWMPVSYNGVCNIAVDMIAFADPDDETLQKYHEIIYDLENMDQVTKIKW